MDVKSAFLNGDLQEEVYMTQPPRLEIEGQEHKVYKLIKALYGLKQAPQAWYAKMDEYLKKVGFQRSESDDTLYVRQQRKYLVILVMYVDDLIITGYHDDHIAQVEKELQAGFKMTDLGLLHYYLGVEVFQRPHHIFISQTKRVLRYIQGTKYFGLLYTKTKNFVLGGYSDGDFAGSINDRASTLGYLMNMGSVPISWSCKKQAIVATSLAEAEYISTWEVACEIVWLHRILQDLGISQAKATSLFIDSQSAMKLAKNPVFHSKTKHVDTKYHHIRSIIAKDVLKLVYCPSQDQISDIFTKPLGRIKFTKFRDELGICCNVSLDHRRECYMIQK
eukprot:PITA_30755